MPDVRSGVVSLYKGKRRPGSMTGGRKLPPGDVGGGILELLLEFEGSVRLGSEDPQRRGNVPRGGKHVP